MPWLYYGDYLRRQLSNNSRRHHGHSGNRPIIMWHKVRIRPSSLRPKRYIQDLIFRLHFYLYNFQFQRREGGLEVMAAIIPYLLLPPFLFF